MALMRRPGAMRRGSGRCPGSGVCIKDTQHGEGARLKGLPPVMGSFLLPCGGLPCRATFRAVDADTLTIIGAVLAVGLALAGLSLHTARPPGPAHGPVRGGDGRPPRTVRGRDGRAPDRDAPTRRTPIARRRRARRARSRRRPIPPVRGRSRPPRPEPRQQGPHLLRIQGHPAARTTRRPQPTQDAPAPPFRDPRTTRPGSPPAASPPRSARASLKRTLHPDSAVRP